MKKSTALAALCLTALIAATAPMPAFAGDINLVVELGKFDHYLSSTQLDYLVLDVEGRLVYVKCSTDDPTGCDEFNADETVKVTGHLDDPLFCDDGSTIWHFNPLTPAKAERCGDGVIRICVDLAD